MQAEDIIEIGILLYPGAQMAAVLGLTDLFVTAQRIARDRGSPRMPELRISHWQRQTCDGAMVRVQDTHPGAGCAPKVLILPPSLEEPISTASAAPYRDWLRAQHGDGVTLASVCAGAFLLGETGLLAGRTVTTHWHYAERFMARRVSPTLQCGLMEDRRSGETTMPDMVSCTLALPPAYRSGELLDHRFCPGAEAALGAQAVLAAGEFDPLAGADELVEMLEARAKRQTCRDQIAQRLALDWCIIAR